MTAMEPCPKCHSTEHPHIEITDDNSTAGRSVKVGCTGCHAFAQIGYVPTGSSADGRRPPMREAGYHCRHCGPTAIFPKKCEPKGVGHD